MNIESYRDFCLSLPYVSEKMPFDDKILVFRIGEKIFALVDIDSFEFINLKCKPEKAVELRALYEEVRPGYHMNKKNWNSVYTDGNITQKQFEQWTIDSYKLVYQSLTQKLQKELPLPEKFQ